MSIEKRSDADSERGAFGSEGGLSEGSIPEQISFDDIDADTDNDNDDELLSSEEHEDADEDDGEDDESYEHSEYEPDDDAADYERMDAEEDKRHRERNADDNIDDDEYLYTEGVTADNDEIERIGIRRKGGRRKKHFSDYLEESILVSLFKFIVFGLFYQFKSCFVSRALSNNSGIKKKVDESAALRIYRSPSLGARIFGFKKKVVASISSSLIISGRDEFGERVLRTHTRLYGAVLLSVGVGTIGWHIANMLFFKVFDPNEEQLYAGVLICLPAIVLLTFGGTVLEFIRSSRILRGVVFGFFGANIKLKDESPIYGSVSAAFLCGFCISALSLLAPLHKIIIGIIILIGVAVVLKSPEFGAMALIASLPFIEFKYVCMMIAAVWGSFILKFFSGKRVISYQYVDMFPFAFALYIFLAGAVSFGTLSANMLLPAALVSLYFLVSGLIRDKVWASRCRGILSIEAAVIALFGALRMIPGNPLGIDLTVYGYCDLGGAADSVFTNSGALSVMLLMLFFMQLAQAVTARRAAEGLIYLLICGVSAFALAVNANMFTVLVLVVVSIVFLLLVTKKFWGFIAAFAIFAVFMPAFGLPSVKELILTAMSPFDDRVFLWKSFEDVIADHFLVGIGVRGDALAAVYDRPYDVSDPKSLIVYLTVSLGMIGVAIFIVMIYFVLQYCFTYGRNCSNKKDPSRLLTYSGVCAVLAALLLGLGENVWYNYRAQALFWIIMGFTVSVQRYSAGESSRDYLDDPIIIPEI